LLRLNDEKFLLLFIAGLLIFSAQMVKKRERRKDARKKFIQRNYCIKIFPCRYFGGEYF